MADIVRVQDRAPVIVWIYCASKWDARVWGVVAVGIIVVVMVPGVVGVVVVVVGPVLSVIVIRRQKHISGCANGLLLVVVVSLHCSSCGQTAYDDNNEFVQLVGNSNRNRTTSTQYSYSSPGNG